MVKASTYERRHTGDLADAILRALMTYHGCIHHAGANSGACLADFRRTDLVMDLVVEREEGLAEIIQGVTDVVEEHKRMVDPAPYTTERALSERLQAILAAER